MREIASSDEIAFRISTNQHDKKEVKHLKLAQYFPLLDFYLGQFCSEYDFSEHVKVFFESCQKLGLVFGEVSRNSNYFCKDENGSDVMFASLFNNLICLIRNMMAEKKFTRKLIRRKLDANENHQKLEKYINSLFQRHERLLILRLDLSYLPKVRRVAPVTDWDSNQVAASNIGLTACQNSQEDAKADLEKLLNYARREVAPLVWTEINHR